MGVIRYNIYEETFVMPICLAGAAGPIFGENRKDE